MSWDATAWTLTSTIWRHAAGCKAALVQLRNFPVRRKPRTMGAMVSTRASSPLAARALSLAALALLLSARARAAPDAGAAIIAQARAAEAAQVRALARTPVRLHTSGRFGDGKTTHRFESFRHFDYRADGTVSNSYDHGHVDGKPVTEDELRKAMGIKEDPREHDDVLTWALAPLSSRDIEVTAVGPAPSDGYTLRCRVTRDAVVSEVVLVVDARTGRKRSASIQMAGMRAKLADKLENILSYGDDGAPTRFHSSFRFKMGWIERSAEVSSERVDAPAAREGVTAPR